MNIYTFADGLSSKTKKMRELLASGNSAGVYVEMMDICGSLAEINEREAAAKFRGNISGFSSKNPDEIETLTEQFILEVSSLSVDLQMAAHRQKQGGQVQKVSGVGILAVDNAVMFLNTLKRLLANTSYNLHCVTSGQEALDFLATNQPSVILLDIEMPDMDGYELARKIKQSGQKAPIIFITANSDREYIDKAAEVGASGLLLKPLRINQLTAKLKEYM
jgi:CheY-like chemotaxis protein